jgi:predicted DCC family thiol-disulfide oxidoreductase YuxK
LSCRKLCDTIIQRDYFSNIFNHKSIYYMIQQYDSKTIYLIYDGECPICNNAAQALKIRKAVGNFIIINARTNNPLVLEAKNHGYDLDEGLLVKYQGQFYYGKDGMHILAILGSKSNLFNKINSTLFRSKILLTILYPVLKFIRRCLLMILGVKKIKHSDSKPIFKTIFSGLYDNMPVVLKKRYSNRIYSEDILVFDGNMNIRFSKFLKILMPLLKLFKALVPYEGTNIPTRVYAKSREYSEDYVLERHFKFPNQDPYVFCSKFIASKNNTMIEIVRFGIGLSYYCILDGNKIKMKHKCYVWHIFGKFIPIPLELLMGKIHGEEESIDENSFKMTLVVIHPWFGKMLDYNGQFKIL